jgi:two-component system, NtrC family, response regulator AtoC
MPDDFRDLDAVLDKFGPRVAFETLTSLLPDIAVFVVDGDRNIVLWSDGAEQVLGFSRKEALGRLCLGAIRCRTCMLGCGLAERGTIEGHPLDLYRKDGQVTPTRKYAKAIYNEDGTFAGGIEVLLPTDSSFVEEQPARGVPEDVQYFHGLVSRDRGMHQVFQIVRNIRESDAPVLVRGESGTGKELIARAVHDESERRAGPFVAVNCAALTPSLVESELFGHKKGAFTGAIADRAGLFAQAAGGTLFLDEVAELPLEIQAKLLRVLEAGVVTPVGSNNEVVTDMRIITATHRSLRDEVESGAFRADLMYRLRVVPIFLPALCERTGDVELLLNIFLKEHNKHSAHHIDRIAPDAMRALLEHDWPGNVRELRNTIEYAFAVGQSSELHRTDLPPEFRQSAAAAPEIARIQTPTAPADEAAQIAGALTKCDGNVGQAAALLGMSRPTFWRKRKKYSL